MRALRVLHVTPYYEDAWAYGGIPRLASTLARGLARRGHQVTVCTTDACDATSRLSRGPGARRLKPWPTIRSRDGVVVQVFPNLANRLAYRLQLFAPLGLSGWLARHAGRFDVAHLHGCHHLPGAIAARHLRRAGVPYVLAPNGTGPRIERRRLAKRVFDATLGRRVLPGAARVTAVTAAERRQLAGLGVPAGATRMIPNPVDLAEFRDPPRPARFRARLGGAPGSLVLYLGTLTPRKNVDVLIRAVALLREARPGCRGVAPPSLVVAGNDFGVGHELRRLARRLGLEPLTRFIGLLRGPDRLDALAAADVVAYPSRDEVFGLVPLEAILCGTPVVVAGDSGCGEIVGEIGGGAIVPAGDPAALAGALAEVLGGPETWRQRVARARDEVERRYAAEVVCGDLEAVYREVAGVPRA